MFIRFHWCLGMIILVWGQQLLKFQLFSYSNTGDKCWSSELVPKTMNFDNLVFLPLHKKHPGTEWNWVKTCWVKNGYWQPERFSPFTWKNSIFALHWYYSQKSFLMYVSDKQKEKDGNSQSSVPESSLKHAKINLVVLSWNGTQVHNQLASISHIEQFMTNCTLNKFQMKTGNFLSNFQCMINWTDSTSY